VTFFSGCGKVTNIKTIFGVGMQVEQTVNISQVSSPANVTWQRRYDVDWLRTLAMGLLIIYHVVLSFQPWASLFYFPQNEESLEGLWIFMAMINVWRIPILFLISGMGVRFAMERRNWKQLLQDRTIRILLPLVFGFFFINPISAIVIIDILGGEPAYVPNVGHLWFLGNIFLYVLLLLPLMVYLRNRPDNILFRFLSNLFSRPVTLFLLALPLMIEAWIVNPDIFTVYLNTVHGFLLGLVCFLLGFLFISTQNAFWPAVEKIRWPALLVGFSLYLVRLLVFQLQDRPDFNWLVGFESMSWMLAILGFGSLYLNKPSRLLAYCSPAVYPVYIVHLPIQFVLAYYLLPLPLPAILKFVILLAGTFGISILLYEFVLRRIKWIRPLFGMKLNQR
jgi:glucan biosynthesis protein C